MRTKKPTDADLGADLGRFFGGKADPRLALAGADRIGLTVTTTGPAAGLVAPAELERSAAAALGLHGLRVDAGPRPRATVAVELHLDRAPGGAVLVLGRAAAVCDLVLPNPGPGAAMLTIEAAVVAAQRLQWADDATAGDAAREVVQTLAGRLGAAASDARRLAGSPGRLR